MVLRFVKFHSTVNQYQQGKMDQLLEFDLAEILDKNHSEIHMNQDQLFRIEQFADFAEKLSKCGHMHKMNWHMTKKNDKSFIKITFEKELVS